MWAQALNILVGLWVMIAPARMPFEQSGADSGHIAGPLIVTFAITALWEVNRQARYANAVIGLWLLAAPWVLGYNETTTIVSDMAAGAICIALSLVKGKVENAYGGGWASLWKKHPEHYQNKQHR